MLTGLSIAAANASAGAGTRAADLDADTATATCVAREAPVRARAEWMRAERLRSGSHGPSKALHPLLTFRDLIFGAQVGWPFAFEVTIGTPKQRRLDRLADLATHACAAKLRAGTGKEGKADPSHVPHRAPTLSLRKVHR
jgi:hypothetical protein